MVPSMARLERVSWDTWRECSLPSDSSSRGRSSVTSDTIFSQHLAETTAITSGLLAPKRGGKGRITASRKGTLRASGPGNFQVVVDDENGQFNLRQRRHRDSSALVVPYLIYLLSLIHI